jgi:glycosyltransferase involved in cell wall biosynthesis
MQLSIVIPAWNEEKLLPETLAAVQQASPALTEAGISLQLIVCDNNSTDSTAAIACSAGAEVIFEPQNQISRARNTGATLATGDWILFLDADSAPSHAIFADLAAVLHDASALYGGCSLHMDAVKPGVRAVIGFWHRMARWRQWAAGSFLFVRRDAFVESGGFSTELFASEEIEFSKRLAAIARRRGQRFVFLTAHPLHTSARKLHTHGTWYHLKFVCRTLFTGGRTLRRREACGLWYDGRR